MVYADGNCMFANRIAPTLPGSEMTKYGTPKPGGGASNLAGGGHGGGNGPSNLAGGGHRGGVGHLKARRAASNFAGGGREEG